MKVLIESMLNSISGMFKGMNGKKLLCLIFICFMSFLSLSADKIKFKITLKNGQSYIPPYTVELANGESRSDSILIPAGNIYGGEYADWHCSYSGSDGLGHFHYDCNRYSTSNGNTYDEQDRRIPIDRNGIYTLPEGSEGLQVEATVEVSNFIPVPKFKEPIIYNFQPDDDVDFEVKVIHDSDKVTYQVHEDGVVDDLEPPPEFLSFSNGRVTGKIPASPKKQNYSFHVKATSYTGTDTGSVFINVGAPNVTGFFRGGEVPEAKEEEPANMRFSTKESACFDLKHYESSGTLTLSISGGNKSKFEVYTNSSKSGEPLNGSYSMQIKGTPSEHPFYSLSLENGSQRLYIFPKVIEGEDYGEVEDGCVKLSYSGEASSSDEVHFKIYETKVDVIGTRHRPDYGDISEDEEEDPTKNIIGGIVPVKLKQKNIDTGVLTLSITGSNALYIYKDASCSKESRILFANEDNTIDMDLDSENPPDSSHALYGLRGIGEKEITLYLRPVYAADNVGVNLSWSIDNRIVLDDTVNYKTEPDGINMSMTLENNGGETAIGNSIEEYYPDTEKNDPSKQCCVGRYFKVTYDPGGVFTGYLSLSFDPNLFIVHTDSQRTNEIELPLVYDFDNEDPPESLSAFANGGSVTLYFTSLGPVKSTGMTFSSNTFLNKEDPVNQDDDTSNIEEAGTDNNNAGLDLLKFEVEIKKADIKGFRPKIVSLDGTINQAEDTDIKKIDDNEKDAPQKDLDPRTDKDGKPLKYADPEENPGKFIVLASDEPKKFGDKPMYYAKIKLRARDITFRSQIKLEIDRPEAVTLFNFSGKELDLKDCVVNMDSPSGPLAGLNNGGTVILFLKGVEPGDVEVKLTSNKIEKDNSIGGVTGVDIFRFNVLSICPCQICSGGDSDFFVSSIAGNITLGNFDFGRPVGTMKYYSNELDENCANPNNLEISVDGNMYFLNSSNQIVDADGQTVTVDPLQVSIVYYAKDYSPNTALQGFPYKLYSPACRVDFSYLTQLCGSESYVTKTIMDFYKGTDATPYRTVTMHNTFTYDSGNETFNVTSFKISNTYGGVTRFQEYTNDASGNLQLNDNGITRSLVKSTSGDMVTMTYYTGSQTSPVSTRVEKYQDFDWGRELVESTDSGQTTTYEYYSDRSDSGSYGKLKKTIYPKANYVTYSYNEAGRLKETVSYQGGNAYKSKTDKYEIVKINGVVSEYLVDPVTGEAAYTVSDTDTFSTVGRKEINYSYCNNYLTSKRGSVIYYDYSYAPDQDIIYDASGTPYINYTYKISDTTSDFYGKVSKTVNYDGTGSINTYSKETDAVFGSVEVTTSYSGKPALDGNSIVDGVKTISKVTEKGVTVYSASYDIVSNTKIAEQTAITLDSFGRVTKTQYMDGSYSERSYGCCGVDWEIDRNGTRTDYTYDNATKRMTSSTRDGIATLYQYDDAGNTTATTIKGRDNTELTSTATFSNGLQVTSTDPMNYTTTYSNYGDTVTYPNNTYVTTTYTQGVATGTTGTAVHPSSTSSGADANGSWTKDNVTNVKSYSNMLGQQYKTIYADNTYSQTFYNTKGQVVKQVSPSGKIVLNEYDDRGRLYRTAIDMNLNGTIDGLDEITQYAYSYSTRDSKPVSVTTVTRIVDSNQKTLSVSESTVDGMESWTTANGLTSHSYTVRNGSGSVTSTVEYPGGAKTVSNSLNGRTITVQQYNNDASLGNLTTYTYDEFNRVDTVAESYDGTAFNTTSYVYDNNGRATSVTVNGRTTSYVYDNMGRRTSMTLPGSRTINYTYHNTGELSTQDGAETYKQSFAYDSQGRLQSFSTYKDGTTPQTTSQTYNNRGFMTAKTYADGKGTTYTYNADGSMVTRVWSRGITTTYGYDNAGRQTSVDYSDSTPDISFSYDWMGNVSSVTDAAGTRNFTYDYVTAGHPGLTSQTVPYIVNHTLDYTYDGLGRRTGMSLKNSSTPVFGNTYTYDTQNRLATVSDGVNTATYTRQDGTGLLTNTEIKNNGTTVLNRARTYDQYYRLTSVTNSVPSVPSASRSYTYDYNDKDQRIKLTMADGTYWEYAYDDLGQVIGGVRKDASDHVIPGQSFGYDYDGIGNRLWEKRGLDAMQTNYTSNNVNQYTQLALPGVAPVIGEADEAAVVKVMRTDEVPVSSGQQIIVPDRDGRYFSGAFTGIDNSAGSVTIDYNVYAIKQDPANNKELIRKLVKQYTVPAATETFTYDDDGNMLTNGDWTYSWNGENRLITAEKLDAKLEFAYDYMGRRFSKKVYTGSSGNWTLASEEKYVYDGYKQIAQYDSSDILQKTYTWQSVGQDVPMLVKDGSNYYYYMVDGNKNIRAMVDASNNIVAEYAYDPFGRIISQSGTYASTNPFRFSSECHDDETGLVYYNFRYYDPALGRWLSRDPIEEIGGYNLYVMVGNNTINHWDELGQDTNLGHVITMSGYDYLLFLLEKAGFDKARNISLTRLLSFKIANHFGNESNNPVVEKLINRFVYEKGDYKLTVAEMDILGPVVITFDKEENKEFISFLYKNRDRKGWFKYKGSVFSTSKFGLNRFYRKVDWCLRWKYKYLEYKGTEEWVDDYNFDETIGAVWAYITSNEGKTGSRTSVARLKTYLGKIGLIGRAFHITSERKETTGQSLEDRDEAIYGK